MPKSTYWKNLVVDAAVNNGSAQIAVPWISLHSANPGLTGANELAGGNYGRVDGSACFPPASAGASSNDAEVWFAKANADWNGGAPYSHFGIWDAETSGNFLYGQKIGTWSADMLAWLIAMLLYKLGDGSDPGAAPTFTAIPRITLNGDTPHFAVGTLTVKEG